MRDDGKFLNGVEIDVPPKIFIGAAANPFAEPFEWRVHRLAKKIEAGADFVQTQCIYDMKRFREWMKQAEGMGLTEKISILAGVTPLKSGGMARYMARACWGSSFPMNHRMKAPKPAEEGSKLRVWSTLRNSEMKIRGLNHGNIVEWETPAAESWSVPSCASPRFRKN
jgi:methylenetetrahydrofolate reductase (NADPH)